MINPNDILRPLIVKDKCFSQNAMGFICEGSKIKVVTENQCKHCPCLWPDNNVDIHSSFE